MVDIILGKQQKIILPKTIKLLEILFFLWILSRPVGPSSEENDNSALLSKVPFLDGLDISEELCHCATIPMSSSLMVNSCFLVERGDLASAINLPESCRCSYCLWTPTYTLPDLSSFRNIYESLYIAFGYLATYGLPWFIVYSYLHLGNLHQFRPVLISLNYFRKKIPETPSTCI